MKEHHSDILSRSGRWILEELQIYDPYSGVTNNQSESLNRVLKDLQGWKEAPVDCVLLALYQLQAFYINEIHRGLAGMGEYHITDPYAVMQSSSSVEYVPTSSPTEIVSRIKNRTLTQDDDIDEGPHAKFAKEQPDQESTQLSRSTSAEARAELLLQSNQIFFLPNLHVFNVKGTSGVTRVVTLFPRETCSCPSTGTCYHILAVKLSLGMKSEKKNPTRNLTHLRRNTRSRKEKRSGRKRPRPNDVQVKNTSTGIHLWHSITTVTIVIYFPFTNIADCSNLSEKSKVVHIANSDEMDESKLLLTEQGEASLSSLPSVTDDNGKWLESLTLATINC